VRANETVVRGLASTSSSITSLSSSSISKIGCGMSRKVDVRGRILAGGLSQAEPAIARLAVPDVVVTPRLPNAPMVHLEHDSYAPTFVF